MNEQQAEALKKANENRLARAAMRAEIEKLPSDEGLAAVADLVANPPRCLYSLESFRLLQWVTKIGEHHARIYCLKAGVSQLAMTGWLTKRQRTALCAALRGEEMEVAA